MTEPFAKLRMALFCYGIAYFIVLHCVFYCMELCILLCRRTRHTFASNLLYNGANIKTIASLLSHAGLKHTEKYTRAVDSLKREAITPCLLFFDGGTKLNAHS